VGLRVVLPVLLVAASAGAQEAPFEERVGHAIDRGVAWLRGRQGEDGSWGGLQDKVDYEKTVDDAWDYPAGPTALALLTLCKCGVAPDDAGIERGFAWLKENHESPMTTYEVATVMMAIEARHNPWKRETQLERERRLRKRRGPAVDLPRADARWMRSLTAGLVERFQDGGWRYGGRPGWVADPYGIHRDMSSTQFAMLGLYLAHRCGAKVPADVLQRAVEWTLDEQEADGPRVARFEPGREAAGGAEAASRVYDRARGWAYTRESPNRFETAVTGTMTTGGLVVLLAGHAMLGELAPTTARGLDARVARGVADGLAWVDHEWRVDCNPPKGKGRYHLLYLYGLERVGDLTGRHLIGSHDWYREGADWLLGAQREDGSWERNDTHPPRDLLNTCFALLFLERATLSVTTAPEEGR